MGNRFKMDPQKSYTIHLVDRLSFAVSLLFVVNIFRGVHFVCCVLSGTDAGCAAVQWWV